MRVRLRFERVYGTLSRYGEKPHEAPSESPILLENYPLPGEGVTIHFGQPVEDLYQTYQIAIAGGHTLVRRNVLHENITEADEAAEIQKIQKKPLKNDFGRWNWYITIVIERTIEVPDAQCNPVHWFSLDPVFACQIEREFLTYCSFQADFLVDHLTLHIPKHFFAERDVEDRVVFFAGNGPPFRIPQITGGKVTGSTSGPIHLCQVEEIRATLSKLKRERQMALDPLAPGTLVTLVQMATNTDLKGRALEELVSKLFSTIPALKVEMRNKTATEEIDISIFNDTSDGFLSKEGAIILAECKNWSGKCGREEFSLLEMKAKNRRDRCSLSFLISWNGFTVTIEKELLRSSRQRLVIVPLTGNDLIKAVANNNFFEVIQTAWRGVVLT